jgi:hypothetical protein
MVVNVTFRQPYDIYVGRRRQGFHFGNPFSHDKDSLAAVVVASRDEAVACFREWLVGTKWQDVEPDRRKWILVNLWRLRGKVLGCHCYPLLCHATILSELAENGCGEWVHLVHRIRCKLEDGKVYRWKDNQWKATKTTIAGFFEIVKARRAIPA